MTTGLLSFARQPASFSTLAQSFGTNLNEVWSTTLENTSYSGFAFTAKRADNSASFDIAFVGKHADPSAASHFSGTTALVTTIYGQINGLNAAAMSGSAVTAFIDTDGYWSFGNTSTPTSNSPGLVVADNALLRPSNPHLFMLTKAGEIPGGAPPYSGEGLLVEYGGTGAFYNVGRYGFGFGISAGFGFYSCQNGSSPGAGFAGCYQNTLGEAHVDSWHVWDHSPSTLECRFDAGFYEINAASGSTNITYPSTTQLNLMSDFDGNTPYLGSWRQIALYSGTQSSVNRNLISSFMMTAGTSVAALPLSFTDELGFAYAPNYFPSGATQAPDLFGLSWSDEFGGYEWPSFGKATNLTNSGSADLVRFRCRNGDSDVVITGAQRAEQGAYGNTIVRGGNGAVFGQFWFSPGSPLVNNGSNWGLGFQVHYLTGGTTPDLAYLSFANEVYQAYCDSGGTGAVPVGSSVPIVRSQWWAFLYRIKWSANGASDGFQFYLGPNGTPLTKLVDQNGAPLFSPTASNGYPKRGFYTGNPDANPDADMAIANFQFSTTLTAFDSFITSQPALPAH